MSAPPATREMPARSLEPILAVAAKLAAPFDLPTMLREVVDAAVQVLDAERGAVWLYDPAADELVLEISRDVAPLRVAAGKGLVGACARSREAIVVPDCYADPRFDPTVDKRTGFRTRCAMTLPLIDHEGVLVGVMQVLNKAQGAFEAEDRSLALVLAAQCAIALQRVRMTQALLEGARLRREMEMARSVQLSTLPARMPAVPGYDVHGDFRPADITGGDTFDLSQMEQGLLVVLGDATGHGIAPALSVTQMQAMLRMAFRLGADLETTFRQVNNQLAETLADDRFITAFIGMLDVATHRMKFHSGGQGPILLFRAATQSWTSLAVTSFPLAAMPLPQARPAASLDLAPGDILVLLTDGIYEFANPAGELFGEDRVRELVARHRLEPTPEISRLLLEAVHAFAAGAPQEDDITVVLVKRDADSVSCRAFARTFDSLAAMAAWSAEFFARERIEPGLRGAVDVAIEELFTNMVKYGGKSTAAVRIEMRAVEDGVEVRMIDRDVDFFDVSRGPEVAVDRPAQERVPGGLGLHLVRRMVEDMEYRYVEASRECLITFRKTLGGKNAVD